MLTLKNCFTGENVEFENSTELKEFLSFANPTALKSYKSQLETLQPDIKIVESGSALKICKR
jgi:hypothetical protein